MVNMTKQSEQCKFWNAYNTLGSCKSSKSWLSCIAHEKKLSANRITMAM